MALHILLVEDNPADAGLVSHHLNNCGSEFELTWVETLAAARSRLLQGQDIDAVLLDLKLPDGSGVELLTWIRDKGLPVSVVMFTGTGDEQATIASLQAGADDYLTKNTTVWQRLPATLRDACRRFRESSVHRAHVLKVLYAEPSQADLDLTRRHLERYAPNIRISAVSSADEILAHVAPDAADRPAYDVLLLDYRLPGLDALEVVKKLRAERSLDIPIVIVTGHGSESVAAQATNLGVDDYIVKHAGYLYALPHLLEKVARHAQLQRERLFLRQTGERLGYVLATSPVILYTLRVDRDALESTWVSGNIMRLMGFSVEEALQPGWWWDHLHPGDREAVRERLPQLFSEGQLIHEYRFYDATGRLRWIRDELRLNPVPTPGTGTEVIGAWRDITEIKHAEQIREARIDVLDGLVVGRPQSVILEEIVHRLETIHPEMRISILLYDDRDKRLYVGSAPSLPPFYNDAVDGLQVEVGHGACGSAAVLGEPVIIEDLQTHPYAEQFLTLTERAGLRACWSVPFKDKNGQVLGTFGIYYDHARTPSGQEIDLIDEFARLTGLTVEQSMTAARQRLAGAVLASAQDGVLITDLQQRIIDVNDAFVRLSGYSREELLGKTPRILRSGRQSRRFYTEMWASLLENGHWTGELWNRRKNGEIFPELLTVSAVRDEDGAVHHFVGVYSDISTLKEQQKKLEHLAHYDALTGLPNRVLLADRLHQAMAQADRRGDRLAVVYLDLDGFKTLNDKHGHEVGDLFLAGLSQHLKHAVREEDTLARLGGDEFVAVLVDLDEVSSSLTLLCRLLAAASHVVKIGELDFKVSASLGVTYYPQEEAVEPDQLLRQADQAMYQAKLAGRNCYHVFDADHDRNTRSLNENLEYLRQALANHEFVLFYQPKVNMRSGEVIGVEALVRWQHPDRGLLSPVKFLPLIEDHPLSIDLGEWVIEQALTQMEQWQALSHISLSVSVNIGARQLQQANFVERLRVILDRHSAIRASSLELEVLETSALEDFSRVSETIQACHALGVKIALDDFGTGYSSLTYLKRLPVALLKIDQSFVRNMLDDPDDLAILDGIVGLALAFRRGVIAEGVETAEHGELLLQLGCELGQGDGIARPMPGEKIPAWLASWQPSKSWRQQPQVARQDLPLIFAGVEHRAMIAKLESLVRGEGNHALALMNHHQCLFGQWLQDGGMERWRKYAGFDEIAAMHQRLHALSLNVHALATRGNWRDAQVVLDGLHEINNRMHRQIKLLVRDSHIREPMKAIQR